MHRGMTGAATLLQSRASLAEILDWDWLWTICENGIGFTHPCFPPHAQTALAPKSGTTTFASVSTVEEIKQAIGRLPPKEQDRLMDWLYSQELKSAHAVMEGIARGEDDHAAGRIFSQTEARERMARWLK